MTLEGVPIESLGYGSGWLIVALFVLAILRGNLIPRRTYDDGIHDRDMWRAAHMTSEAARVKGEVHLHDLLEATRTMDQLMREVQDRLRPGGGRPLPGGDPTEEVP